MAARKPFQKGDDTRKLLRAGFGIFGTGALAAVLMLTVLGGVSRRQGPHTNLGWLALMIAMGCLPTGTLTLALGLLKWVGDHRPEGDEAPRLR